MTDTACGRAFRRAPRWRPGVRTAGLACALAAWLVLPPGTAGAAVAGRAGPALGRAPAAGRLVAWGFNSNGQLGDGTTTEADVPVAVNPPAGLRVTAARGAYFSVAVTPAGQVKAWGFGRYGQLGNGRKQDSHHPVAVRLPRGTEVTAARAGEDFTVALTTKGTVLAWGSGTYGRLGNGASRNSDVPVRVRIPAGTKVTAVSAGYGFGLALTSAGRVLAWGDNAAGDLGNGKMTKRTTPVQVRLPSKVKITAVSAGQSFGLAVTSAGQVYAWGDNAYGQLGDGTTTTRTTPVLVHLPRHTKIVSAFGGGLHSLALTAAGRVLAWGYNLSGQLGDGTQTDRHKPVSVRLSKKIKITALAAGRYHSMALTSDGLVLAWGSNSGSQLGDGNQTDQRVPVRTEVPGVALAIGSGPLSYSGFAVVRKIVD
jgi:alpha-tubulin suppressor-like RCC1 family protein